MTDDYKQEYVTKSGFVLKISPLPPYYMDIVNDVYPVKELPRRQITLLAGDSYTEEYIPPETPPGEDDDDFQLYAYYTDVVRYNGIIEEKIKRAKRDMLLSTCVTVMDGPVSIEEEEWISNLEAAFGLEFSMPDHTGMRALLFLKHVVLDDVDDAVNVIDMALFKEVSEQGISRALQSFRSDMGQSATNGDNFQW